MSERGFCAETAALQPPQLNDLVWACANRIQGIDPWSMYMSEWWLPPLSSERIMVTISVKKQKWCDNSLFRQQAGNNRASSISAMITIRTISAPFSSLLLLPPCHHCVHSCVETLHKKIMQGSFLHWHKISQEWNGARAGFWHISPNLYCYPPKQSCLMDVHHQSNLHTRQLCEGWSWILLRSAKKKYGGHVGHGQS